MPKSAVIPLSYYVLAVNTVHKFYSALLAPATMSNGPRLRSLPFEQVACNTVRCGVYSASNPKYQLEELIAFLAA